jgi:hypothetical protein
VPGFEAPAVIVPLTAASPLICKCDPVIGLFHTFEGPDATTAARTYIIEL